MLPFYQSLSSSKKYDFTFLFYNRRNVPLPSAASNKDYDLKKFEKIYKEKELKINFQFISNTYSDTYGIKSFYFNPKIFFMKKNYDLVIVSDNLKFPDIFFRIYCKINSIPLVIWSETTHVWHRRGVYRISCASNMTANDAEKTRGITTEQQEP